MNKLKRFIALAGAVIAFSCQAETGPTVGSETHFLRRCVDDAPCGDGLACLCGACSATCSESVECDGLGVAAECVNSTERAANQTCGNVSTSAMCEVRCELDGDCANVLAESQCDRGYCRRREPGCLGIELPPEEIVFLGDRVLADSGLIQAEIGGFARASGSLGEEQKFRDYSSSLVSPFGMGMDLASQYTEAKSAGPVGAVVLNAGGPDALLDCDLSQTALCPTLRVAAEGTRALFLQMEADAVRSVVLFFYPTPDDESLAEKFDVLRPLIAAECESSQVPCLFVDLRVSLDANRDQYLTEEGLIPTSVGSEAAAGAIWSAMQLGCAVPR